MLDTFSVQSSLSVFAQKYLCTKCKDMLVLSLQHKHLNHTFQSSIFISVKTLKIEFSNAFMGNFDTIVFFPEPAQ